MLIPIDDDEDPRLADYRAMKETDLVGRRKVFIAEGTKVVALWAAQPRYPFRSLFIGENRKDAIPENLPPNIPIYVAPQRIMDRIVGFPIHRGFLAAGDKGALPSTGALLAQSPEVATVVAGIALANHDNVGALFRNAAALGASAVLLDDRSADPLYRKSIRVSMGHALTMPTAERGDASTLVSELTRANFAVWAATPRAAAKDLARVVRDGARIPDRIAIVVGSEGEGLAPEILAAADLEVRIPMAAGVDSLNVATAAAIVGFAVQALRAG